MNVKTLFGVLVISVVVAFSNVGGDFINLTDAYNKGDVSAVLYYGLTISYVVAVLVAAYGVFAISIHSVQFKNTENTKTFLDKEIAPLIDKSNKYMVSDIMPLIKIQQDSINKGNDAIVKNTVNSLKTQAEQELLRKYQASLVILLNSLRPSIAGDPHRIDLCPILELEAEKKDEKEVGKQEVDFRNAAKSIEDKVPDNTHKEYSIIVQIGHSYAMHLYFYEINDEDNKTSKNFKDETWLQPLDSALKAIDQIRK